MGIGQIENPIRTRIGGGDERISPLGNFFSIGKAVLIGIGQKRIALSDAHLLIIGKTIPIGIGVKGVCAAGELLRIVQSIRIGVLIEVGLHHRGAQNSFIQIRNGIGIRIKLRKVLSGRIGDKCESMQMIELFGPAHSVGKSLANRIKSSLPRTLSPAPARISGIGFREIHLGWSGTGKRSARSWIGGRVPFLKIREPVPITVRLNRTGPQRDNLFPVIQTILIRVCDPRIALGQIFLVIAQTVPISIQAGIIGCLVKTISLLP